VFATAVTKPGHGNIAPLAIGFTLFASAFVGKTFLFNILLLIRTAKLYTSAEYSGMQASIC